MNIKNKVTSIANVILMLTVVSLSNSATIIGNDKSARSFRPMTKIHRLVLGTETTRRSPSYKIGSISPIYVFIDLNEKEYGDELSIEADQNLQKFFFTESDGNVLRLYLDSFDNNTDDALQLTRNAANSSQWKPVALENNNTRNYIKSNDKIKIYLKTSSSYLNVSKVNNFGIVNLYFKLNRDPLRDSYYNSFNKINCNGQILFNNKFIDEHLVPKIAYSSTSSNQNVFVYWCNESFEFSIQERNKTIQYSLTMKDK